MSETVKALELRTADLFDRTPLDKLAEWIAKGHDGLRHGLRRLAVDVGQIGSWLVAAKGRLPHGEWLPWIAEHCPEVSERTAQNYMRVYGGLSRKAQELALLQPTQAYKLLGIVKEDGPHVLHNSGDNEWYTPPPIIEAARLVMGGIDLDPASSDLANTVVKATKHFTKEDDGLAKEWHGRVWMNPPYASGLVERFVARLLSERSAGRVTSAVVLTNNCTETDWWQRLAEVAVGICFIRGRIRFWKPDEEAKATGLQGQTVCYLGESVDEFIGRFASLGVCIGG